MPAYPSLSRILAAGSGLGGLGYLMTRTDPSVEGVLTGLSCLVLCIGFSALPAPKRPARRTPAPPLRPPVPEPRTIDPLSGPQPHRLLMAQVVQPPAPPTQPERSDDLQPGRTS